MITVQKAIENSRLRAQVRQLSDRARQSAGRCVAGESPAMREVLDLVERVALASDTTVLIQGESGTGKELIAERIHRLTPRRSEESFVALNCASMPEALLESELFGHERGAFTDAKSQKHGLFEEAGRRDPVPRRGGGAAAGTQAKLLRVLQETTFRRVGGTRDLTVSVRVIAATNKDLAAEVQRGSSRLDLYHRLDVFHIGLPALRERREDIVAFARHFLAIFAQRLGKPALRLAPEAEAILRSYDYPGNIRELRNIIERAAILANRDTVEPAAIILRAGARPVAAPGAFFALDVASDGQPPPLVEVERAYIARLLEFAAGIAPRWRGSWACRTRRWPRRSPTTALMGGPRGSGLGLRVRTQPGCPMSDVRGPMSRMPKPEVARGPMSDVRCPMSEARCPRSEVPRSDRGRLQASASRCKNLSVNFHSRRVPDCFPGRFRNEQQGMEIAGQPGADLRSRSGRGDRERQPC